ncbi:ABC transporter ATP-binding protein [Geomesophilobacter sediminis]|uniref:ATP-binding cassette domain-containing protein n=1 Tax=Geomesophilobacter sediminis TaxID=2798584 RepID=A0A8J7J5C1_9BACT|nr:oligopeptide/dipeptide ABC transporter ATP-binding protein [Geomesophilobacter sediminis]MBJ6723596.1 ATP-binding cassette domain-containing protein [Geomesophilobacter sediminis]
MSAGYAAEDNVLLRVEDLVVEFSTRRGRVQAVSGVSFELGRSETLGMVGESGCGKSSLARAIMQLPPPTGGRVLLSGHDLTRLSAGSLRSLRRQFQMVFQDPASSLNPMRPVGKSIEEPLRALDRLEAGERERRAREMMTAVGLDPDLHYQRLPRQLSGGQCQRVSIARALVTRPKLLVCDEPVASLDVSIQAQILNLLREIRSAFGLAVLFIAHDLAVVKQVCDRVAVMYLGRLCEVAPTDAIFHLPAHPYTRALLAAAPRPDPGQPPGEPELLPGELPSPLDPPSGCRFRTRCPRAKARCAEQQPELRALAPGHLVACHYPHDSGAGR